MSSFNAASSGGVLMWTRAPIAAGTPQGGGSVCVCVCVCVLCVSVHTHKHTYIHVYMYIYKEELMHILTEGGEVGHACR